MRALRPAVCTLPPLSELAPRLLRVTHARFSHAPLACAHFLGGFGKLPCAPAFQATHTVLRAAFHSAFVASTSSSSTLSSPQVFDARCRAFVACATHYAEPRALLPAAQQAQIIARIGQLEAADKLRGSSTSSAIDALQSASAFFELPAKAQCRSNDSTVAEKHTKQRARYALSALVLSNAASLEQCEAAQNLIQSLE